MTVLALYYFELSKSLFLKKNHAAATAYAKLAISFDPTVFKMYDHLVAVLVKRKEFREVINVYESGKGRVVAPVGSAYYLNIAKSYFKLGFRAEARTLFYTYYDSSMLAHYFKRSRKKFYVNGYFLKEIHFFNGFANAGFVLHVKNKEPLFISKFSLTYTNYQKERYFYSSIAGPEVFKCSIVPRLISYESQSKRYHVVTLQYIKNTACINSSDKGLEYAMRILEDIKNLLSCNVVMPIPFFLYPPSKPKTLAFNMHTIQSILCNFSSSKSIDKNLAMSALFYNTSRIKADVDFILLVSACNTLLLNGSIFDKFQKIPHHYAHCDLKEDNILTDSDSVYIIDWGNFSIMPYGYDVGVLLAEFCWNYDQINTILNLFCMNRPNERWYILVVGYFHCLRKATQGRFKDVEIFIVYFYQELLSA